MDFFNVGKIIGMKVIKYDFLIQMVNTAATAMIIPIVMAIINELRASKAQIQKDDVSLTDFQGTENHAFEKDPDLVEKSGSSEDDDQLGEVAVAIDESKENISKDEITDFERGIILSVPYSCSIGIWFNAFKIHIRLLSAVECHLAPTTGSVNPN